MFDMCLCFFADGASSTQCTGCPGGQYFNGVTDGPCQSAMAVFFLHFLSTLTCFIVCSFADCQTCPSSYVSGGCTGNTDATCGTCDTNCATCNAAGPGHCLSCTSGNLVGGFCCDVSCATCGILSFSVVFRLNVLSTDGASANSCTSCNAGYYFQAISSAGACERTLSCPLFDLPCCVVCCCVVECAELL